MAENGPGLPRRDRSQRPAACSHSWAMCISPCHDSVTMDKGDKRCQRTPAQQQLPDLPRPFGRGGDGSHCGARESTVCDRVAGAAGLGNQLPDCAPKTSAAQPPQRGV